MNTKVTSLLLVFVMLFCMVAASVPSYAASSEEFVILPNKTEVAPGDTVTYSVVIGPIENFQSANFTLIIPDGLTFVSGAVTEGLKELTGATEAGFENSTLTFYHGGLEAYTCDHDTVLMTFTCTVKADASGEYEIRIMDDYDFADNAWTSYDMIINTAASRITVSEKTTPATGIALNKETLSLKVGESETLVATLTPADATDVVVWTSSDNAIATVDANGKVTAVAEGTATITAQAGDVSAACVVTTECAHTSTTEHPAKESTCTEQGNGAYTTCDDCGDVIEGSGEKLPLDPDNHVDTTTFPADTGSCINPGHAEYSFCNDCKSIISGSNSPVAGPHGSFFDKAEEKYLKTAADCDSAAVYYKSCELCGEAHATETFTYGDPLGHSYSTTWSKGADGHWRECSACGDKTDFAAHNYGDGDKCVICEYERAHIHRLTLVPAVDATCTNDGNIVYYTCSGCENWFEDASGSAVISDKTIVVIAAQGHDLTDATCNEVPHCKRDGCDYSEGSALGHTWIEATCEKVKTCSACGATEGIPLEHKWTEATCEKAKTCAVCGKTDGSPLGHQYIDGVCKFCGQEDSSGVPGDVNRDGKATYADALLILRASIGLETLDGEALATADVNRDGKPTYADALLILRASIGLEELK